MVSLMTALWFARAARRGPGLGQAARLARAARDQLPARPARPSPTSTDAARVRRPAELPEPRRRTRTRSTTRPARSGSAPRRRSGARSRTATSADHFEAPPAAARSRCSATPSSTRARSGRRSPTRWSPRLGEVLWVVDLNRQSLDRVVPDIAVGRLAGDVRGGRLAGDHRQVRAPARDAVRRGRAASAPRAASTRCRNEEYQRLLRAAAAELRERLPGRRPAARSRGSSAELDDAELAPAVRDLGGHDLGELLDAYRAADARRPADGRLRLHDQGLGAADRGPPGEPLGAAHRRAVRGARRRARRRRRRPVGALRAGHAGGRAVRGRRPRARARRRPRRATPPAGPGRRSAASTAGSDSTQQALGRFLVDLVHEAPEVAERVVTVCPDVATSTNLGGWINQVGIWSVGDRATGSPTTPRRWCTGARRPRPAHRARHRRDATSSACSASWARPGAATASRCCRSARSTTRSSAARSSRGRSASTPAGSRSSSARRRGSRSRPRAARTSRSSRRRSASSSRAASPGSPPSARTSSGRCCTRSRGSAGRAASRPTSASRRGRSTRRSPAAHEPDERRQHVLAGGYRLRRASGRPRASRSSGMGAVMPEVLAAADELGRRTST